MFKSFALSLATEAHCGQFRRDGVTPYIEHPLAVADYVASKFSYLVSAYPLDVFQAVAILHDVVEDTSVTLADIGKRLRSEFPNEHHHVNVIVDSVEAITKRKGESQMSYLTRVKQDAVARVVKLADMAHNMSDLDPVKDRKQLDKYEMSTYILLRG